MSNPRSFTTNFVAIKTELEAFTKPLRSAKARRAAIERAITMPNRLPKIRRERAGA